MPVFYPSSTRDTAAEVTVANGSEVTGIDIQYRGDLGCKISGSISGSADSKYGGTTIVLHYAADNAYADITGVPHGNRDFELSGLHDGEYVIWARRYKPFESDLLAAAYQRVTIKGADVKGVDLKLTPLSTVSGKFILEKSPVISENNCAASLEKTYVSIRRDEIDKIESESPMRPVGIFSPITDQGTFTIPHLLYGRHRLHVWMHMNSYIKSITIPAPRATRHAGTVDISQTGLVLRSGDNVSDLTVTLAEGAARLAGKVVAANGSSLPFQLRVYLVPAEVTAVDDLLRYYEIQANLDHTFVLRNIAPGKYWLLSRPIGDEYVNIPAKPLAWDNNERMKLRKEAEARNIEVELKPCQRVSGLMLNY